ncbi:hypothetical protein AOQ84DRAFT_405216 [Glonium stellatum]|uniref:HD domain-containing protein n=1 Tax=Glonium stellatum TaxID=574774 RepID=A0A8E2EMH2_9PEZI|nr:hypothetical protein AOQ84DRAFT_405216 [Glonium stellatum]
MNTLPTRVYCGVTVPDTPSVSKALELARRHSTDYAYNHIHAVATILHDVGWNPTGELISADKRFEVDSADAARNFLKREAPDWDKHKIQLVWDAIALHTIGSIVFYKEPEVQACSYGIWADFQGPDRVPNGLLTLDEYNLIVQELPRLGLMKGLKEYVEGYSRKGKLTQDLLDTCDLD